MSEEKTMHLGVTSDQVGKYVFLPGSVERASLIAKHFDNSVKIAHNREYLTYTGLSIYVRLLLKRRASSR